MKLSEIVQASAREAKTNLAKPAFKHINKAIDHIGLATKALHEMREPEMDQLQARINKLVSEMFKIMVPLSDRARRPS